MAFSSTPTHGLYGNIYWLRPNGFKGSGLNDLTWGGWAESGAPDSAYYEVVIDGTGPDTFKWRECGGSWTETVAITGSAQTLVGTNGTQTITFGATTGHTLTDQWSNGSLYAEATTEATVYAQITDTTYRLINPNSPPTFTDSGSKNVISIDYAIGKATFDDNVSTVTVAGDNCVIFHDGTQYAGLQQLGYIKGFSLNTTLDLADASRMGQKWKEYIPGQAGATGTIEKMLIANHNLFEALEDCADGTQAYFLLQLFTYDPDQDQTGTHILMWVTINSYGVSAPNTDLVKSNIGFTVQGIMSTITANA